MLTSGPILDPEAAVLGVRIIIIMIMMIITVDDY